MCGFWRASRRVVDRCGVPAHDRAVPSRTRRNAGRGGEPRGAPDGGGGDADRVDPRAALSPPDRLRHHPQRVGPLGKLVRAKWICHLIGLKHREGEQLIGGRGREQPVLLGAQRREAMAGLQGDDDAGAAAGDNVSELFQHQRGAVEIDLQDGAGRCLRGRDARGVDHAGHVSLRRGRPGERVDRWPRRDIDGRGGGVEPGIAEDLGGSLCILRAQVGQQNVLARAHAPGDGLADRSGADDDDDAGQCGLPLEDEDVRFRGEVRQASAGTIFLSGQYNHRFLAEARVRQDGEDL